MTPEARADQRDADVVQSTANNACVWRGILFAIAALLLLAACGGGRRYGIVARVKRQPPASGFWARLRFRATRVGRLAVVLERPHVRVGYVVVRPDWLRADWRRRVGKGRLAWASVLSPKQAALGGRLADARNDPVNSRTFPRVNAGRTRETGRPMPGQPGMCPGLVDPYTPDIGETATRPCRFRGRSLAIPRAVQRAR
jgi:hypothetical protein